MQSSKNLLPGVTFPEKGRPKGKQIQVLTFLKRTIMMEFITAPLIVWICVSGIYKLFELYAGRKERMFLYERLGDRLGSETFKGKIELPMFTQSLFPSFNGLKIGCLLVGAGLGLIVGMFFNFELGLSLKTDWHSRELSSIAYGAPLLLFGGLGLIVSFLIEKTHRRNSTIQ
jgi:hypothetical protein